MPECWKDIPGYEVIYQVSDRGRVRRLGGKIGRRYWRGRILKMNPDTHGHLQVRLCGKSVCVHRLVLETFIGLPPAGREACHNDGRHQNNRLSNLRWGTHKENMADVRRHCRWSRALKVRCSDGQVYNSCVEAAEAVGVHRSSISRSIYCGQRCAGFTWEFVDV